MISVLSGVFNFVGMDNVVIQAERLPSVEGLTSKGLLEE